MKRILGPRWTLTGNQAAEEAGERFYKVSETFVPTVAPAQKARALSLTMLTAAWTLQHWMYRRIGSDFGGDFQILLFLFRVQASGGKKLRGRESRWPCRCSKENRLTSELGQGGTDSWYPLQSDLSRPSSQKMLTDVTVSANHRLCPINGRQT